MLFQAELAMRMLGTKVPPSDLFTENTRNFMPQSEQPGTWRFAIDRGGTFTDVVLIDPSGTIWTHKVPSGG